MYVLGIHPDGEYFRSALLSSSRKKIKIIFLGEYRKEILDLNQLKKRIQSETKGQEEKIEVASALEGEEVFIRGVDLPTSKTSEVQKALPFQEEKLFPFSSEQLITVPEIKKRGKRSFTTLYAFLPETMEKHIQAIKTLGFDPDWVSCVPKVLKSFVKTFAPGFESVWVFHFGWKVSYLVYIENDVVKQSVVLHCGMNSFIEAIKDDHPDLELVDFDFLKHQIESVKSEVVVEKSLCNVLTEMRKQLFRGLEFLERKKGGDVKPSFLATGYSDIAKLIVEGMDDFSVRFIETTPHLEYDRSDIARYAIEIGAAIEALEKKPNEVQFRGKRFISKKSLEKAKKKMSLFFGLGALSFIMAFGVISGYYIKRQNFARDRFNYFLTLSGEDVKRYRSLHSLFLSEEQFNSDVDKFIGKYRKHRQQGEFLATPPLISDSMRWITPAIPKKVKLESFNYILESFPTIETPKTSYKAKLSFKFLASEVLANEFFQNLKKSGKDMIEESTLNKEKEGYEIVLYLS